MRSPSSKILGTPPTSPLAPSSMALKCFSLLVMPKDRILWLQRKCQPHPTYSGSLRFPLPSWNLMEETGLSNWFSRGLFCITWSVKKLLLYIGFFVVIITWSVKDVARHCCMYELLSITESCKLMWLRWGLGVWMYTFQMHSRWASHLSLEYFIARCSYRSFTWPNRVKVHVTSCIIVSFTHRPTRRRETVHGVVYAHHDR